MSDIVERLRARPLHVPTASRDMAEAADEIERLRAENRDWMEAAADLHLLAWRGYLVEGESK